MMDIIDSTPMTTPTPTSFVILPTRNTGVSKQATATAHSSHSHYRFRQEIGLRQHRQLQTYLWQHHRQHTTDEHHCHYRQQRNETWQTTSLKAVTEDKPTADGSTKTGNNTRTRQDQSQSVSRDRYNKARRQTSGMRMQSPTKTNKKQQQRGYSLNRGSQTRKV